MPPSSRSTLTDGRVLRSRDLVGARLVIAMGGQAIRVRLDGVEPDPDAKNGTVWLHTFSAEMADGSWQNVCDAGPDGRRQGFPVAGRPRADGMLEPAEPGIFELACTSGALGKCVRFGYPPWAFGERHGAARCLQRLHPHGAGRLLRRRHADHQGRPDASTSMTIIGIQKPENDPAMEFEAGWTADGAACVRHARVKENVSLESLVAACPG